MRNLDRVARGRAAEALAARSLEARGWRIHARNHRCAGLEVDLLASDPRGALVAVEVRCRPRLGVATPAELLGPRKLAALRRQREAIPGLARVDLLLVLGGEGRERLRLLRGIAEPCAARYAAARCAAAAC